MAKLLIVLAAALAAAARADIPIADTLYREGDGKIEGDLLADSVKSVTVSGSVITVVQRDADAIERTANFDVAALAGSGGGAASAPDDFEAAAFAQLFALAPADYETKTLTGGDMAFQAVGHGTLEAGGFGALDVSGHDLLAVDYDDQINLTPSAAGFAATVANSRTVQLQRDGAPSLKLRLGRTRSSPPQILVSFPADGTYKVRLRDLTRSTGILRLLRLLDPPC